MNPDARVTPAVHVEEQSAPVDNPLILLRRRLGLGQAEFARALGVSLPSLWCAEKGTTAHPTALFHALQQLGYNAKELAAQYTRWRVRLVEDERFRLKAQFDLERSDRQHPAL